jgi:syntaxin-binding protein 5
MLAQARSEAEQVRRTARSTQPAGATASSSSGYPDMPTMSATNEGWGAWATRQFNERTDRLNDVSDSMNNLQQNSAGWADDVNKFVTKQKRGLVLGAVKGKFGF